MFLAEGIDRFEQAVTVKVSHVDRTWAGLRTFAPDRTPVVGFDPRAEGFFWLAGQGGVWHSDRTSPVRDHGGVSSGSERRLCLWFAGGFVAHTVIVNFRLLSRLRY